MRRDRRFQLIILAALAAAVIILGLVNRAPVQQQQPSTVEFIVSGSPADVTYGPSGSGLSGSVPLDASVTIPSPAPAYYAVNAQLQGGGEVTCEIRVDGAVISAGRATGSYNITTCEIIQGPSGDWESAT
jgi:hypothetical protein